MKKNIIIVLSGLTIVLLVMLAVNFLYNERNFSKTENSETSETYRKLNSVTYDNFPNFLADNRESIVYIGRPTCSDCNEFEPDFIDYLGKNDLTSTIVYLNVEDIRKNEDAWEKFKKDYDINYTPTLAYFKKNKLISKAEWRPEKNLTISKVDEWLSNIN